MSMCVREKLNVVQPLSGKMYAISNFELDKTCLMVVIVVLSGSEI